MNRMAYSTLEDGKIWKERIWMKLHCFSGTYFDVGEQLGKVYRKNGMEFGKITDEGTFHKQLQAYERYFPSYVEELEGIAKGGNFDSDLVKYKFLTFKLLRYAHHLGPQKGCTIFGVQNRNGAFVGRSYDWEPITEKVFQAYRMEVAGKHAFIGVTDMAIVSGPGNDNPARLYYDPNDTLNDQGVFIGALWAYNSNKTSYGLSHNHMLRYIAENCKTTKEALDAFKNVPMCIPKNFLIADSNGEMAIVEHTSKDFVVILPENGILVQTNHYLDPELAKQDTVLLEKPGNNTFKRFEKTYHEITKRQLNFRYGDIMQILGDTESCICQDGPMKTIWSLALDMKKQKYALYWNLTGKREEMKLNPAIT